MMSPKVVVVVVVAVVVCAVAVQGQGAPAFNFMSFLSPPAASPDCPKTVAKGGVVKVADPDDCGKFSLCTAVFSTKLDCPPLQHFSKEANECLPQELAGCDPAAAATADPEPEVVSDAAADEAVPAVDDVTDEAAAEPEA